MNFIRYTRIYLLFSATLIVLSIAALIAFGLNFGIDFTGGSIMELEYKENLPSAKEIENQLSTLQIGLASVQPAGEKGMILRMNYVSQELHQEVLKVLGTGVKEQRFEAIGPVVGRELRQKTIWMIIFASLVIVFYIGFAFLRTGPAIHAWELSGAALLATLHDIVLPLGAFATLGKLAGVQVSIPVVIGLLTVVGYSINDTIVVFDRLRENLRKRIGVDLAETINKSLNQTIGRSVSTSFTVLLVLAALYFFGGSTLKYFALILIIGVVAGTYSSIFLAPPALYLFKKRKG